MSAVACRGVAVGYRDTAVLSGVDLTVAAGEVVALLGSSGSGKSTLLHAIAGFVPPLAGEISLAGEVVSTTDRCTPPERRRVGMVFQDYALWPHLSALDIVAYPFRRRGLRAAAARDRARALLAGMGLAELAQRRPAQLSGGEQQRVGLARALACEPAVYLFDEPTAHLDAHLRAHVLGELARRRAETGAAALLATHDCAEALAIADRVAVLHDGRCVQVGTPAQLYAAPVNRTVAGLTGPVSVLTVVLRGNGDALVVEIGAGTASVAVDPAAVRVQPASAVGVRQAVVDLLVRPDWARLDGALPGILSEVRFGGPHTDYHLTTPAGPVIVRESGPPRHQVGTACGWTLDRGWVLSGAPE